MSLDLAFLHNPMTFSLDVLKYYPYLNRLQDQRRTKKINQK